jgi:hypothetical protein
MTNSNLMREGNDMANPIRVLLDHFIPALERVAPERARELEAAITNPGVTFAIEETDEPFLFSANPTTKRIRAGVGCLGRLWATAYAYYCFYTGVRDVKLENVSARELDLKQGDRMTMASRLLEWTVAAEQAIADAKKKKQPIPAIPWPDGLPRPSAHPVPESDEHVADELFLAAGAFILHHELAHLRLGHKLSDDSEEMRRLEYEADMEAARWLLQGLDEADDRFLKRAIGIALALAWMTSLAVFIPEDSESHPPSCDRLYRTLDNFVHDPDHLVWAFADTILRANLEARHADYDEDREATSFKDDVEYCIEILRKYRA